MDRNYDVITNISKYLYFKRPGVAIFADIIKILTMLIKTMFRDWKKVQRIRDYVLKRNLYFLIQQNLLISGRKMLISAGLKGCVGWFPYILDIL